jgi:ABC-2 type transport system permease protein
MKALVSTELLKLRTTRALFVGLGVVLLFTVALPIFRVLAAGSGDLGPVRAEDLAELLRAPVPLAGGAVLLIGLLAAAGEFRHHTVITTRLAGPRSGRVLAAKLATMGLLGLAVGVAIDLITLAESAIVFNHENVAFEPMHHGVARVAFIAPLILALHGVFGVAIGSLLRSTTAAVGATLVWAFVVEGIIPVVTSSPDTVNWLPTGLVKEILQARTPAGQLAPLAAAGVLLGYGIALVGSTVVLDRRREL